MLQNGSKWLLLLFFSDYYWLNIIVLALLRLYVHVPTDPQWSKDVANLSGNFLLILNFQNTYNPTYNLFRFSQGSWSQCGMD